MFFCFFPHLGVGGSEASVEFYTLFFNHSLMSLCLRQMNSSKFWNTHIVIIFEVKEFNTITLIKSYWAYITMTLTTNQNTIELHAHCNTNFFSYKIKPFIKLQVNHNIKARVGNSIICVMRIDIIIHPQANYFIPVGQSSLALHRILNV